jgi:iron complex transport system substrate-binding protein
MLARRERRAGGVGGSESIDPRRWRAEERSGSLRVVSLLPSATEIVCALGAGDQIVAVSHECDFPDAIRGRPVVSRARVASEGPSAAIDGSVRALVREALSIYSLDEDALAQAAPDLIVTQDLCEVCAVSLDDVQRAVERLAHRDLVRVVSLRPTRLGDVLGDIERIAAALGRSGEGERLRAALEARIAAIASRVPVGARRPTVASIEWIEPLMLAGTWMPELIELAGGRPVGPPAGALARTIDSGELARLRPDVVLVKPCGFALARTLAERERVERSIVAALAPGARVYATDGNAFFNRPGPRLVESLEILAACIHPEIFMDFRSKHADVIWSFSRPG